MPSANANTVQLVIYAVDANSGQVLSTVAKNFDKLGASGSNAGGKLKQGLNEAGEAGAHAAQRTSQGFQEMGGHALTSLDNVRLLRDDLGIRIPRSMEKAIASSKVLSGVIGAVGGGLLALGTIELGIHVGKEAWDFYDKLTDINKEVRKYEEGAARTAAQRLFAADDVETQLTNLRMLNTEVTKLQGQQLALANKGILPRIGQQVQAGASPWDYTGLGFLVRAGKTVYDVNQGKDLQDAQLAQNMQWRDTAAEKNLQDTQAADMRRLRATRSAGAQGRGSVGSVGYEQETSRLVAGMEFQQNRDRNRYLQQEYDNKAADITKMMAAQNKSKADIQKELKTNLGLRPETDPNAGLQQFQDASLAASETASGKRREIAQKETSELAQLRAQAAEAGLQGEAKYRAELTALSESYRQRERQGDLTNADAFIEQATRRFNAEQDLRRKTIAQELTIREMQANAQGLTGLAKMDAEHQIHLTQVEQNSSYTKDEKSRASAAETVGYGQDVQKAMDDYREHFEQMDDARTNSSMTANQRVLADARRTVAQLKKTYDDLFKDLKPGDPHIAAGQAIRDKSIAGVNSNASEQIAKNNQQLSDETRKLQLEAGRGGGGNRYAQQMREIQAEEEERLQKVEEQRRQAERAGELAAVEQFEQQKSAIQQIARNKELDLVREQRDKLAGELRGFMSNPLEALKRQGEELASKFAADMLMGRRPGSLDQGKGNGGMFDLFRPAFARNGGLPGAEHGRHTDAPTGVPQAAQQATVRAATAVIHVGSATFNGAGAPSPAVSAIASGGYAPTGNGGYFNLGNSPAEAGSPAAVSAGGSGPSAGPAPEVMTGGQGGMQDALGIAQQGYSKVDAVMKDDMGIQGGLRSKIPGLKNMSDAQFGKLGGAASGAMGVYAAFEGKGGWGGAASGALSGAQVGLQYGGLAGAAIGAVVGGVLGFIGHGARVEAQKYWFREVQPKVKQEMAGFEAGTADYQSVYDDLTRTDTEAKQRTHQMGSGAVDYYDERIHPELMAFQKRLTREQKAGRSQFGMTAAQFDVGGRITGFGSLATYGDHGFVHAQKEEFIVQQGPAADHYGALQAIRAGASHEDMASYYGAPDGSPQRAAANDSGDVHLHVHTMDVRGVRDFLTTYKHDIRGAVNASYGEDSGGADSAAY